jgi:photosystem II stability/assembly factor-like uncharacterized protein
LARIGNRDDLVIDNILVDPAHPMHLVVGAWLSLPDPDHPDDGIYISEDGGATWTIQPQMRGQSVRSLTLAPSDPNIFLAGTLEAVFRSTDSGAHWERISPKDSAEIHEVESLAVDPADPNIIYAGTWHLPWKTTDAGKSWTSIKQGIIEDSDVFSIVVDPKQPNVVYLSACSGIYKSEDAGGKFTGGVGLNKTQGIPSTARRTRVLMQDPNNLNTVYAGTTEGLYRTFDAGKHWFQTTGSDVIVNDVYVDPANSKHVLLATDRSGVLASDDGGDSFLPSNTGFSARYIASFTADRQHPATVYVGVVNDKESGGVFVSHAGGLRGWSQLSAGLDGHDVNALGQAPDGSIVAGTEHGIYRLKDGIWQRAADNVPMQATTPTPLAVPARKTRPVRKAAARRAPVAKPRAANADAALMGFDGSVNGFAVTGETLFAATSQGVLRSPSSGVTWSRVSAVPVDDWRFVAAAKSTVVVASLSASEVSALEMSTDGGNTWRVLTLPAKVTQVSALSVDGQGDIWVGDRDGIYYSNDKGANWHVLAGLVVRNVESLYYDAAASRILVTAKAPATEAFAVEIPSMQVHEWETGWDLRFVRPVGDYLLAATLFDGVVVQPVMVDSAEAAKH